MNFKIKTSIKIAIAVLATAIVFCLATPTVVKTDKIHTTLPVQAAMVTEMSVTTTIPVTTSITIATTATSTTTTDTSTTSLISTSTTTTLTSIFTTSVEETELAAPVTTAEVTEAAPTQAEASREYIVYKPSTHYIHKSTCHWVDSTCYEITDTNDIECKKCSECNPDLEVINLYVEPTPVVASNTGLSDYDRQLLAEITQHEAGSNWISQYNKAKIVAGVMNRVNDSRFPNTVYDVLVAPYQFTGYWPGCCTPTQACYDAVDYYFAHTNEFNSDNSWQGDGYQNYFYYQ